MKIQGILKFLLKQSLSELVLNKFIRFCVKIRAVSVTVGAVIGFVNDKEGQNIHICSYCPETVCPKRPISLTQT